MLRARRHTSGFTMVELIVALAVAAVLIGLLLWGVQKVRDTAARMTCINNMGQVALGVNAFHDNNGRYPTYNGIFPVPTSGDVSQAGNRKAVYGSYLVHILPQIGLDSDYKAILADVSQYTNTGKPISTAPSTPGTPAQPGGPILSPAVPGVAAVYDTTGLTYRPAVPATYNTWNATKVPAGVTLVASPTSQNGATVWVAQIVWSPPQKADLGTNIPAAWLNSAGAVVTPPLITPATAAVAAVYGPPGPPVAAGAPIPGRSTYAGTFKAENRETVHPVLLCPADPSPGTDPNAPTVGHVYPTSGGQDSWSSTNYLANWNALCSGTVSQGFKSPSQQKTSIGDGLSNTILLAEAYSWCDGKGRTAYVAWHENDPTANVPNGGLNVGGVHNFGLTNGLQNNQIKAGNGPAVIVSAPNGYPNPNGNPLLIFDFQVQPRTLPFAQCPANATCCNNLTVQSGHSSGLNVALCDGSVRTLRADLDITTWQRLLLPNDGQPITTDW
jgi:prepilin-type N-terminal cleavage/methylation domain-containing protein/prepilin-type processing-associated H-X9-DG protein